MVSSDVARGVHVSDNLIVSTTQSGQYPPPNALRRVGWLRWIGSRSEIAGGDVMLPSKLEKPPRKRQRYGIVAVTQDCKVSSDAVV